MEPPAIRIGWLKMLLGVLSGTGGRELYAELIADVQAQIRAAEAELRGEPAQEEATHVRERA